MIVMQYHDYYAYLLLLLFDINIHDYFDYYAIL